METTHVYAVFETNEFLSKDDMRLLYIGEDEKTTVEDMAIEFDMSDFEKEVFAESHCYRNEERGIGLVMEVFQTNKIVHDYWE